MLGSNDDVAEPGLKYNSFKLLNDNHSLGYSLTLPPAKCNISKLGHMEGNFLILEASVSLKSIDLDKFRPFNLVSLFQSSGMDVNVSTPNSLNVIRSIFTDLIILSFGISVMVRSPGILIIILIRLGISSIGKPTIIILWDSIIVTSLVKDMDITRSLSMPSS